jgi:hypothetical protein
VSIEWAIWFGLLVVVPFVVLTASVFALSVLINLVRERDLGRAYRRTLREWRAAAQRGGY